MAIYLKKWAGLIGAYLFLLVLCACSSSPEPASDPTEVSLELPAFHTSDDRSTGEEMSFDEFSIYSMLNTPVSHRPYMIGREDESSRVSGMTLYRHTTSVRSVSQSPLMARSAGGEQVEALSDESLFKRRMREETHRKRLTRSRDDFTPETFVLPAGSTEDSYFNYYKFDQDLEWRAYTAFVLYNESFFDSLLGQYMGEYLRDFAQEVNHAHEWSLQTKDELKKDVRAPFSDDRYVYLSSARKPGSRFPVIEQLGFYEVAGMFDLNPDLSVDSDEQTVDLGLEVEMKFLPGDSVLFFDQADQSVEFSFSSNF